MNSAVLFLTYRRFSTAEKVFESIRQAQPPRLYFASNAPNPENVDEDQRVAEVRVLIERIDWPCKLHTLFRDEHLSVKNSIPSAIDWFFETEEMGIILEDDCLPSQSFYPFCDEMLKRYESDRRVGFITAMNYAEKVEIDTSYFFSRYPAIWGWATWKRVWSDYDVSMKNLQPLLNDKQFKRSFDNYKEYKHWNFWFLKVYSQKVNTWDAQITYLSFINDYLTITPSCNLLSNIGFGLDATFTKNKESRVARLEKYTINDKLIHPSYMFTDVLYDNKRKYIENIGVYKIIKVLKKIKELII